MLREEESTSGVEREVHGKLSCSVVPFLPFFLEHDFSHVDVERCQRCRFSKLYTDHNAIHCLKVISHVLIKLIYILSVHNH